MKLYARLTLMALSVLLFASDAWACSACQGDPDSEMTKGAQAGVILMAVLTYTLLLGVGGLVASWFVRARRMGERF